MVYGIQARKSVILTEVARGLQERIKLCNVVDRLSNNLSNLDEEQQKKIKNNYDKMTLSLLKNCDEYVIVPNYDTDINHEQSKKIRRFMLST